MYADDQCTGWVDYCLVWQVLVTDLVGVRLSVAVLGASVGLFWVLGGGQVSQRP
jgi:hypothetical protein